jgi:predicted transcriptional regulator
MAANAPLKCRIRSTDRRNEAVRLSRAGRSNEEIALELRVTSRMVRQYLSDHLKSEVMFPCGLNPSEVELMRRHRLEDVETAQRALKAKLAHYTKLNPMSMEEGSYITDKICSLNQELVRNNGEICKMYGLYSPPPQSGTTVNITNNAVAVFPALERLKARRAQLEAPAVEVSSAD